MRHLALALALCLPLAACGDDGVSPGNTNAADSQSGDTGATTLDVVGGSTTPSDTRTSDGGLWTPPDTSNGTGTQTADTASSTSGQDTQTGNPSGSQAVGGACTQDADCAGPNGLCLTDFAGGYCVVANCGSQGTPCPTGSTCFGFGEGNPSLCIQDCNSNTDCRTGDGYICDADDTCWPGEGGTNSGGSSSVGGACTSDADCPGADGFCYPAQIDGDDTGFYQGYCMIGGCTAGSCPDGAVCEAIFSDGSSACIGGCGSASDCQPGYGCFDGGICWPACSASTCAPGFACDAEEDFCVASCQTEGCPSGLHCWDDGTCGEPPCTTGSCGQGLKCGNSGRCIPDLSNGPGPGPGPSCPNLPTRDCTAGSACGQISLFTPVTGPGYDNYPLNGETAADQYRSYATQDLQMLIKWATATVACKTAGWSTGNGHPLGLGDMSEANGAIPGTRENDPGHPPGTHVGGNDMDIAYYQLTGTNNYLRAVCTHRTNGADQYHCVEPPTNLDLWRTALFIGLVSGSDRTRVIGVDGQIGPLVEQAVAVLCDDGWLSGVACSSLPLAYEVTPGEAGWYRFHHHHLHVSTYGRASGAPRLPGQARTPEEMCKIQGCPDLSELPHLGCEVSEAPTRALIDRPLPEQRRRALP